MKLFMPATHSVFINFANTPPCSPHDKQTSEKLQKKPRLERKTALKG
jgi:hypothetical protein